MLFRPFWPPAGWPWAVLLGSDFLGQRGDQLRLAAGRALVGDQGRLGSPAHLLAFGGLVQEISDGLGQGSGVPYNDPGAGRFDNGLGPEEISQVRAIDGRPAPGRGLQDILTAMRHQGAAHKGDVGGAVQGKEVADGVDDHHRQTWRPPGRT